MESTEVVRLKRNLTALVEFSRVVNSNLDMDFTLNNLLLSSMGKFLATKCIVGLYEEDVFKVKKFKGISAEAIRDFPEHKSSDDIDKVVIGSSFFKENNLGVAEKIRFSNRDLGLLVLGERIDKKAYTAEEIEFLRTIINIAATAIQNSLFILELKKVNRDLDNRVNRLNSLFEIGKEFGLLNEETRISKLLVYTMLGHFLISAYSIVISEEGKLRVLDSTIPKSKLADSLKGYDLRRFNKILRGEEIGRAVPEMEEFNYEVLLPMTIQNETRGIILLGKRMSKEGYSESDLEFVTSLSGIAITSLENKRLFKDALEKQKMEEELEIAKDIQKMLLPQRLPELKNFEIATLSVSSKQVGGDYYDVIKLDDENYCVSIADVSGKGVPASLLMANLQAFLKSICRQNLELAKATSIINDLIAENTTDGKFITFFWGILNDKEKKFKYVNAGHNPPILLRGGEVRYMAKGGIILGVMQSVFPYETETIELQRDDVLVFFTDGVTEAKNINDKEFTDERLENLLRSVCHLSAKEILDQITKEIKEFTEGTTQSDDITMIIIKVSQ